MIANGGCTPRHSERLSFYYVDPDGNSVELQSDNFGDWNASTEWVRAGGPLDNSRLRYREDIVDGLRNCPGTIAGFYRGENLSGCSRRGLRFIHYGARTTHAVVNGNLQSRKAGFDFQCRGPRCFGRLE